MINSKNRKTSEAQRRAARDNGKLGGRPLDSESMRELRRRTGGDALVRAVRAGEFLEQVMNGDLRDASGSPVDVSAELRVRAASQLYAKGLPDQALVGTFEEAPLKLVNTVAWCDADGNYHRVEGIPGPEEVAMQ